MASPFAPLITDQAVDRKNPLAGPAGLFTHVPHITFRTKIGGPGPTRSQAHKAVVAFMNFVSDALS